MPRVRGPYHHALRELLVSKHREKVFTQESLARATGKNQSTMGQYLRPNGTAGTLDLDEADAALDHIGSSLKAFIVDPAHAITRPAATLSPIAADLWEMLRRMPEDQLKVFRNLARSVQKLSSGRANRSTTRRAPVQARPTRKTAGKR